MRSFCGRDAPAAEATVAPVADPAAPVLADGEFLAVATAPLPAALLPTLAQPATMRTSAAAHHGRRIRRTIAITVPALVPTTSETADGADQLRLLPQVAVLGAGRF
jgi:hypothetical protein